MTAKIYLYAITYLIYSFFVVSAVLIMTEDVFPADNDTLSLQYIKTLNDCKTILENEKAWDVLTGEKLQIDDLDHVRKSVELLGSLRNIEHISLLTKHIGTITRSIGGLPKGFKDAFVAAALVRIGSPSIEPILKEYQNPSGLFMGMYVSTYFRSLLPIESSSAIINDYINCNLANLTEEQKERLLYLKDSLESYRRDRDGQITVPQLSNFTLNHPLYKARQSVIESNLSILTQRKKWSADGEIFTAIEKLGEVRAVEAVEVLVPKLLLKPDSNVKPSERKIDEKLATLKDYPVAAALAEIGIPSIWGLLDEIAIGNYDDDNYREIAYKTMTVILPGVAIPGFVNESLKKHTGETSQLRLYKIYPLMGLPIEGTPLIPQFREWQSTDKLFKTTAKFISLNKGNVTLEKADGKHTTIEFSVLRQEDKDYVKAQPKADLVAMRTWTSSGGKYHIQAKYVSADENQVILKNAEGEVFPVDLSKLSKEDLDYVNKQLEAKPELPKREK